MKILQYIVTSIKRDGILTATLLFAAIAILFSFALGYTLVLEAKEAQIVYSAGYLRLVMVFASIIFPIIFVRKFIEGKEAEFFIASKVKRSHIIYSIFLAYTGVIVLSSIISFLAVYILYYSQINTYGMLTYILAIMLESMVCIAFSLFVSISIEKLSFCMISSIVFYIISRTLGMLVAGLTASFNSASEVFNGLLSAISFLIPRLDLVANSSWLLYGTEGANFIALLQTAIYTLFLIFASIYDFNKKQF